jgi:hypothetical protein
MRFKLKVLGLGLLVTLAMSAVAVMNASATSTGNFHSDAASGNTNIVGSEIPTLAHPSAHRMELAYHGLEGRTVCDIVSYNGTVTGPTTKHITIIPHYTTCKTQTQAHNVTVHVNGCSFTFTPGHQGTVHLDCPVGKSIEITHPNCTIKITPQTIGTAAKGMLYTADTDTNGKKTITLDANTVQIATKFEAGICVFTGTNHTATMHGAVTVRGFNHVAGGAQANITHTAT